MPIRHATLKQVETCFNANSASKRIAEDSADLLFWYIALASRRVDEHCKRRFAQVVETRRFDAAGAQITKTDLMLDDDLLELTAVTNGDGASVDLGSVLLAPYNTYPKNRLILTGGAEWTYEDSLYAAIQITGVWGYHTAPESAWVKTAAAMAGDLDDSAVTLLLTGGLGGIERGHTIQIETEQMAVEQTDDQANMLALERGVNGTTPAAHVADGNFIYYYRPELTVQRAVERVSLWLYDQRNAPWGKTITPYGEVSIPPGLPYDVKAMLADAEFTRALSPVGEVLLAV